MKELQTKFKTFGGLFLAVGLAFGMTACGQAPMEATGTLSQIEELPIHPTPLALTGPMTYSESKIIGLRPFVPVRADGSNMEPVLRQTLDAFGLISIGNSGSCSGTHLGNGYVLTAGHCFIDGSGPPILGMQACPNVQVHWGYRGSPATGNPKPVVNSVSNCTRLIFAELSEDRDFAIFQVDTAPKAAIGIAQESGRTPDNTKITIFGYPMGRPLEWSQYCAARKSIAVAEKPFSAPSRIAYQCDTQPGNSGSSVIAINSAGVPKVVAVHDAAAPDPIQYNIGTYMYDIRQTLMRNGFLLDKALGARSKQP